MKLFDFRPDPAMSPAIGLLHAMVTYNYERLKRLVEHMTQDEIDYRGSENDLNSTAQLLRHLAVVDLHWVFRLQCDSVPEQLQSSFGPMYDEAGKLPAVKGVTLATLLEQYDSVQAMFRDVCLKKTDEDLEQPVPFENGNSATVRWGIWHIADHSRHHYSNIVQLQKLMREHG